MLNATSLNHRFKFADLRYVPALFTSPARSLMLIKKAILHRYVYWEKAGPVRRISDLPAAPALDRSLKTSILAVCAGQAGDDQVSLAGSQWNIVAKLKEFGDTADLYPLG